MTESRSAVTDSPDLWAGRGAESPTRAVFRFIDFLLDASVTLCAVERVGVVA
jgi:hypothetical protein